MTEKVRPFTIENNLARVNYDTLWADHDFTCFAAEAYGHEKTLFGQIASLICLGKRTDHTAPSLPTGGRVVFYELKKPFYHRQTKRTLTHIDVKGVGLTASGYLQDKSDLVGSYREIMRKAGADYPFGPLIAEGTADAMEFIQDLQRAIAAGFTPPPPLALFRPKHLFLNGLPIHPRDITDGFKYRKKGDFPVLLVRGYESTPARVSDYLTWEGKGVESPDSPDNVPGWIIEIGRDRWNEHYQRIPSKSRPNRKQIFDSITALLMRQTRRILYENISPASGKETNAGISHVHQQNYTALSGSLVEWSPITNVSTLNNYYTYAHFLEVVATAYEAYVCFAALILPKAGWPNSLMYSHEFVSQVTKGLRNKNPSITEVYDTFLPRGATTSIGHKIIYRQYQKGEPLFEYLTGNRY